MSVLVIPVIAFVLAWPFALIALVGRLENEKRRPAVSFGIGIIAIASGTIGTIYAGAPASPVVSGIILLSMVTVSASAVATVYFLFRNIVTGGRRLCAAIGSLIQLPFLVALFIGPDKLPGLGILFDALAEAIGTAGMPGYGGFFSLALQVGLYLEVFFGAAIVCVVVGIVVRGLGESATGR